MGTPSEEIDELLPEIMRRLHGDRPVPAGLRALTLPQARTLRTVAFRPHCTMGELARELHVTLGAATGLVDRLVQQGLVARLPDVRDRRVVRLELTESGRRAHLGVVRHVRRRLARALARLTPDQQAHLTAALRLLREALEEP